MLISALLGAGLFLSSDLAVCYVGLCVPDTSADDLLLPSHIFADVSSNRCGWDFCWFVCLFCLV